MKKISFSGSWIALFCVYWVGRSDWEETCIHFFPHKSNRIWGKRKYGRRREFGVGPLLLIIWYRNDKR